MRKSIDRIVNALVGATIALGVIKGPQIYSEFIEFIKSEPMKSGAVMEVHNVNDYTFDFGFRHGTGSVEYTILTDKGETILAASRGNELASQGNHIEFRLGGSIGLSHELYETKKDGSRVLVRVYPRELKDVKPAK